MVKKQVIINAAKEVIRGYTTRLTVRQIYYRLVSKHIIPNKVTAYQSVVRALRDGRLEGQIPFRSIEDRTRRFIGGDSRYETPEEHFESSKDYFLNCPDYYRLPKWHNQPNYVEVWLEKQALEALFNQVTSQWKVRLAPCRGYPSLTYLWEGASNIVRKKDKDVTILYFGDFDPSGLDIPRYIKERFCQFGLNPEFELVAITQDQIEEYNIPPMPTKRSDSRSDGFIYEHGDNASVELDAIDPDVLQQIIYDAISSKYDETIWDETEAEQEEARKQIQEMVDEVEFEQEG